MPRAPKRTPSLAEHDGFRELKTRFDVAHAEGMTALERKDFQTLEAALRVERQIIEEQHRLLLFRLHRLKGPK